MRSWFFGGGQWSRPQDCDRPEYGPSSDTRGELYERLLWGPKRPVVVQAWGGPKTLGQVTPPPPAPDKDELKPRRPKWARAVALARANGLIR